MITVIFTALFLMVAGGVIAYVGDTWGYKLGKKRLTFLGLRPRVTANLLTIVFGVLIALLTFSVLLGVNAGFRVALIQGAAQLKELRHQRGEIRQLNAKGFVLQQQTQQAQVLEQQEATKEQQARASFVQAKKQTLMAQAHLQTTNRKLQSANSQLQVAQAQLSTYRTQVAALKTQQQRLIQITKALGDQAKVGITHHLIYTDGAEVGREVISATQSQTAIRRDIFDFLGGLSDQAKTLGASPTHDNSYVRVASVRIGNSSTFVNESDSIAALAGQIQSQGKGSVVVIAYSVGNSFAHKPVFVRLKPYANRMVIPAGAILGETVIPSQQKGVAEIIADMETFLKGPVHQTALRRGVIPVLPQDFIGGAYPHEIDPAVQQIQQIKGDAVLVALSSKDTYAGDKVSLDFAVHPVSGQSIAAQGNRP